ncbi:MAG TPA: hypothetical protein VGB42_07320, partial [Candidatus Thermoplasmatota archaeon]
TYTVTLAVGGERLSQDVVVRGDPRIEMSERDFRAQFEALVALRDLQTRMNRAVGVAESVLEQLGSVKKAVGRAGLGENGDLVRDIERAAKEVQAVSEEHLRRPPPRMNYRQRPRVSEELQRLSRSIGGVEAPPTDPQMERLASLRAETDAAIAALDRVIETTIRQLNEKLDEHPHVMIDAGQLGRRIVSDGAGGS